MVFLKFNSSYTAAIAATSTATATCATRTGEVKNRGGEVNVLPDAKALRNSNTCGSDIKLDNSLNYKTAKSTDQLNTGYCIFPF